MIKIFTFIFIVSVFLSCQKAEEIAHFPKPISGKTITAEEIQCFKQVTINGKFNGSYIIKKLLAGTNYFYMTDTSASYMVTELGRILNDINTYADTNLVMSITHDRQLANIIIHPTNRQTFISSVSGAGIAFSTQPAHVYGLCMPKFDRDYNITGADIFVDMFSPFNNPTYNRYLLRHEIMHSLGFLGHTEMAAFSNSILSEINIFPYRNYFAEIDKTIIRILYNPALKTGMRSEQLDSVLVNL
jgi:hypothetical protein